MSFQISLSGLNAASSDLNVTANNVANVNTVGFKRSAPVVNQRVANPKITSHFRVAQALLDNLLHGRQFVIPRKCSSMFLEFVSSSFLSAYYHDIRRLTVYQLWGTSMRLHSALDYVSPTEFEQRLLLK